MGVIGTHKCACWVLNKMGNFLIGSDRWLVGLLAGGLVPPLARRRGVGITKYHSGMVSQKLPRDLGVLFMPALVIAMVMGEK